ncbi:hypothetical protein ACIBED_11680 [Rhodococcus coprophilus]|uniref:hypothetical protein n=1 Tax=Rhodococcus coprophilus TaxID=38310 RepID=UPI0037A313A8
MARFGTCRKHNAICLEARTPVAQGFTDGQVTEPDEEQQLDERLGDVTVDDLDDREPQGDTGE